MTGGERETFYNNTDDNWNGKVNVTTRQRKRNKLTNKIGMAMLINQSINQSKRKVIYNLQSIIYCMYKHEESDKQMHCSL